MNYYNGEKSYSNLMWENGRQLASITTGGSTYTYSYDADGIRTQKVVDGVTHTYITQNGKVMRETIGSGATAKVLDFIYDNTGKPFALRYSTNGGSSYATYYYVLNLQGDVVKLVRIYAGATIQEYEEMASYTYNAWGEIISSSGSMADINPLRYRGYYYDTETGFYYLRSRYYDPVNCRFINADAAEYSAMSAYRLDGTNLFAYCGNNPITRIDDFGQFFNTIFGAIVGGIVAAITSDENESTGQAFLRGFTTGAVAGFALDVCISTAGVGGLAIAGAVGAAASVADTIWENENNGEETSFGDVASSAIIGGGLNLLFGAAGRSVKNAVGNTVKSTLNAICTNTVKGVANKSGRFLAQKALKTTCENFGASTVQGTFGKLFAKIEGAIRGGLTK